MHAIRSHGFRCNRGLLAARCLSRRLFERPEEELTTMMPRQLQDPRRWVSLSYDTGLPERSPPNQTFSLHSRSGGCPSATQQDSGRLGTAPRYRVFIQRGSIHVACVISSPDTIWRPIRESSNVSLPVSQFRISPVYFIPPDNIGGMHSIKYPLRNG